MNDGVEVSCHATGMEGPRVKRRKLEQEEYAAQGSGADALTAILPQSTGLVVHRHEVCFGMVSRAFRTSILFHPHPLTFKDQNRGEKHETRCFGR